MTYRIKRQYTETVWGYAYCDLSEEEYNEIVAKIDLDPEDELFEEKLFQAATARYGLEYDIDDYTDFNWESAPFVADKWADD